MARCGAGSEAECVQEGEDLFPQVPGRGLGGNDNKVVDVGNTGIITTDTLFLTLATNPTVLTLYNN